MCVHMCVFCTVPIMIFYLSLHLAKLVYAASIIVASAAAAAAVGAITTFTVSSTWTPWNPDMLTMLIACRFGWCDLQYKYMSTISIRHKCYMCVFYYAILYL